MSLTKSIAKNTLVHTLGKFLGSIIGLLVIGLLTRYLGTWGYGYYTTIFAYLFFFSIIGDLGLYLITINELGRYGIDKQKVYSNIFTMRFLSSAILMLAACGLIWLFPYPIEVKLGTLVISILILLMMLDQILVALFQEQLKTKYAALAEIIGKLAMLLGIFWVIRLNLGFIFVLWAIVAAFLIHFLINFAFAQKLLKFRFKFDKNIWQSIFKKSWPIATYMIFSMIYFKADTIILSLYYSQATVGIYGAPYKILEALIAFPAIFMGLVSPHLSRAWSQKNLAGFRRIFQKAFDFLSLIVWPLILGTFILAKPIINLIAGADFLAAASILRILIVATGIIFIAHLSTFSVVALNKQKKMMKYYILAAVLALILYFILIPKYSYYAAAGVTVFIEFLILAVSWSMVSKTAKIKISFRNNLKSLLASIIMAAVIYPLANYLCLSILAGTLVYAGGLWFLGVLHKNLVYEFLTKE